MRQEFWFSEGKGVSVESVERDRLVEQGLQALSNVEMHAAARKRHLAGKGIGIGLATAGAAGLAYLLWRRSRPIEDPWAEEYWANLTTKADLPDLPVEAVETGTAETGENSAEDTSGEDAGDSESSDK